MYAFVQAIILFGFGQNRWPVLGRLDVCYSRQPENLRRLAGALAPLDAPSPQEEAADHGFAVPQTLALELCRDLLQQVRNLQVLRAFLEAIQAART